MNQFLDRREAGRMLAARLREYANRSDVTVLGVPRGGIPVAYEVARALALPLDVLIVEKVYQPGRADVLLGVLASGGYEAFDTDGIAAPCIDRRAAEREMARARADLANRERLYRGSRSFPDVRGRTIIVVYDGIVTGGAMLVAISALRASGAARVIVAAPVATPNAQRLLQTVAGECVCVMTPDPFYRIGFWYQDFAPVSDASVLLLLDRATRERGAAA